MFRFLVLILVSPALISAQGFTAVVDSKNHLIITAVETGLPVDMTVTCDATQKIVLINGSSPENGLFACSGIKQIKVTGSRENDEIDLSQVQKKGLFTSLRKTRLSGQGGNDTIIGSSVKDVILGNSGNDRLSGKKGNDRIVGSSGNDKLVGGPGNDILLGNSGNDKLLGGSGHDTMSGGSGVDKLNYGPGQRR